MNTHPIDKKITNETAHVGAVIAAASGSSGDDFLPLMQHGQMTDIRRLVETFRRAGVRDIAVVTGEREDDLEKELTRLGVTFLKNENHASSDLFASARIGFAYLADHCDAIFFCPGDRAYAAWQTIRALMDAEGCIRIPSYDMRAGHPVLLTAEAVAAVSGFSGEGGLRSAIQASGLPVKYVEVDDEGCIFRKQAELSRDSLAREHDRGMLRPDVVLNISGGSRILVPDTVTLLRQIGRLGSVREACLKTDISYSRGWQLIRAAEEGLGLSLVDRAPGGKYGGEARLTPAAEKLLARYDRLLFAVQKSAEAAFEEIFLQDD